MLSQKFRLYPSKTVERRVEENLELCRWLYNRLLEELNKAKAEKGRLAWKDTQALIVRLKLEKPELNVVHSKVLQMLNYQLWSNIHTLAGAKKSGGKVGKLRFKGGWLKNSQLQPIRIQTGRKKAAFFQNRSDQCEASPCPHRKSQGCYCQAVAL